MIPHEGGAEPARTGPTPFEAPIASSRQTRGSRLRHCRRVHNANASVYGHVVRTSTARKRLPAALFALIVVAALCAVVVVGGILADHVPTLLILACLAVFGVLAFVREEGRL